MANFGLRGLPGWPLPPPPLIEGVDRRTHRQAKNWNAKRQQSLEAQHGVRERFLSPQRQEAYSAELTTVLRTSPLRKWSQDAARRHADDGTEPYAPSPEAPDSLEEDLSVSGDGGEAASGDQPCDSRSLSPEPGRTPDTDINDNRRAGHPGEPHPCTPLTPQSQPQGRRCPTPAEAHARLSPLQEDPNSVDDEDSQCSASQHNPARRKPSPQAITLSTLGEEEVLEVEVQEEEEEKEEEVTRLDDYEELEYDEDPTSECITAGKSDSYFEDDVFLPIECTVVDDVDVEEQSKRKTHVCVWQAVRTVAGRSSMVQLARSSPAP